MRTALRAALIAALALVSVDAARGQTAAETSAQALLEALDERQMPDVALWVIERAEADPAVSSGFKARLPFLRAKALVGTSRTESDGAKRAAILDEAEKSIDAFLATSPEGDPAIDAYTQKANLLIERGRAKVEQAKRPGQDAAKLSAEAVAFFDGAIKSLQGTVKSDQKEIPKITNAEDAVIKSLRETSAQLAALKAEGKTESEAEPDANAKPTGKGKGKGKGGPRYTPAQQKEAERLEELQNTYRVRLLQTRLMIGGALFEKSKAYPPGSKEATAALDASTDEFKELAEKYSTTGAAQFARYYWGRNLASTGKHELAADALSPVLLLDGKSPLAISLRAKAANASLECWLAMAAAEKDPAKAQDILKRFDESLRKFALTPVEKLPGRRLDAEWAGLKYHGAAVLDTLADVLDAKERPIKVALQRDAKKLAIEVATANKDFAKEARELATKLGKDLPEGGDEKDVGGTIGEARVLFASMQDKQATAKKLQAEGQADEAAALLTQAAADRDAAIKLLEETMQTAVDGEPASDAQLNSARPMLTFLYYDAKRFGDAADLGSMLTERYPNAPGSRQAAKVALASLQQLGLQPDPAAAKEAKAKLASLAGRMSRTWAADAEGADAFSVLLNLAIEAHDTKAISDLIMAFPKESPRRPELAMRAGTVLRREVLDARKLEESLRPDEKTIDGWNATAKTALDEGLAALDQAGVPLAGTGAKIALAAALARVQMALEDGDRDTAGRVLENKVYGPWTIVTGDNAAVAQGQLTENALTVALRYFIESEQLEKAQQAMDALEKVAGEGEEASAKLTAMYLSMGRDLQAQLETLSSGEKAATPDVQQRATRILTGFEKFLDAVAKRDSKISSQIWVATTYLTLGSGKGTGAVVPKAKAEQYLDRSAEAYSRLLARKDDPQASQQDRDDVTRFEPSIRLKMATIFKERGKWDDAQKQLDWILADAKRQNSLDIQVQAAEFLEAAGRAAAEGGDAAKADVLLREAAAGRKGPPVVVWGWGGIANKLSRQAFASSDEKAMKARELFFDARLHVAQTLLERARLGGPKDDRVKRLDTAKTAITMTRKLYPDLGGEAFQKRFEKVLKEIQKEQGETNPGGFTQLDAEAQPKGGQPAAGATP